MWDSAVLAYLREVLSEKAESFVYFWVKIFDSPRPLVILAFSLQNSKIHTELASSINLKLYANHQLNVLLKHTMCNSIRISTNKGYENFSLKNFPEIHRYTLDCFKEFETFESKVGKCWNHFGHLGIDTCDDIEPAIMAVSLDIDRLNCNLGESTSQLVDQLNTNGQLSYRFG